MKISITFSKNEIDAGVAVASDLGVESKEINNMINDFEVSGTNLNCSYEWSQSQFNLDINEKVVTKILSKFRPMITMVTGLVKMMCSFFEDVADEFADVEVKSSLSMREAEREENESDRLRKEIEDLKKQLAEQDNINE